MAETTTPLTAPATAASAPAAPGTVAANAPTPANAPDFAKDWNVAPEVGTWMAEAGYKTPADFASSAWATKKLVGHDPANIIVKPKEGDGAARLAALRALGAPANAADYGLKAPEGGDPKLAEWAGQAFAEAGIPKPEATAIFDKWNAKVAEINAAQADAAEAGRVEQFNAFKARVGDGFGRMAAEAREAAKLVDMTIEEEVALQNTFGPERAITMMAKLGAHRVETAFKGGDPARAGMFGTTAEAAQAEIDFLKANPNHPDARAFSNPNDPRHGEIRQKVASLLAIAADGMATPATANATPAFGNVPMARPRNATY